MLIQAWLDMPDSLRASIGLQKPEPNCPMTIWMMEQKLIHETLTGVEADEFDFRTLELITERPEWRPQWSYQAIKYAEAVLTGSVRDRLITSQINYVFRELDNPDFPDDQRKTLGFIMSALLPRANNKNPDQVEYRLSSNEINWMLVIESNKRNLFEPTGKLNYNKIFDGTYAESIRVLRNKDKKPK